jgi:hypothetical protein
MLDHLTSTDWLIVQIWAVGYSALLLHLGYRRVKVWRENRTQAWKTPKPLTKEAR